MPRSCPLGSQFFPCETGSIDGPSVTRWDFSRILRVALTRLKVPDAARYRSYGFRRGTAQELKETGSPWQVVASSGLWNSPAFRGYVDLSTDVESGVRNRFDVDPESASGADAV